MREINQSDSKLSEALRRMAAASDNSAPAALGDILMHRFRKHHARRRQIRFSAVAVVAVAAAAALVAVIVSTKPATVIGPQMSPQNIAGRQAAAPIRSLQPSPASLGKRAHARQRHKSHRAPTADFNGFLALNSYDPGMTTGQLQIVRLELPGADLRLVGAPVSEDLARRRVLADFVVGQDGTPYAVRLVTSSN